MTAISTFLQRCRQIHANPDTTEESYYPALVDLLNDRSEDGVEAHSGLAANPADKPDLGLYQANLPLLYVEVKLPHVSVAELLKLEQAQRYARQLAGWVLLTNLNDFVLARLEGDSLVQQDNVRLFTGDPIGQPKPKTTTDAAKLLREILKSGCVNQQSVSAPYLIADVLANHARSLAHALPPSAFGQMKAGFRDWLGADLDDEFLVSTAVQAIVYGMFATWLESAEPESFQWKEARDGPEIGVMAEIVYSALSPAVLGIPHVSALLESVAGALRRIDRDALGAQFDDRAIEYFYEPFLAKFDSKLRDKLGVWYTPREIAEYQVARADHHLKEDLGIDAGLADDSVVILDPAAGTGTYIAAIYDHLTHHWEEQGESAQQAAELLRDAATTRIVGFEILPAALLVGDLHLRRHLREKKVPLARGQRSGLYLTNSLLGWFDEPNIAQMTLPWIGAKSEVEFASQFKRHKRVLVVLGNPPYEGYSSATTDEEKKLIAPWTDPLKSKWGLRKHRLNDLYARFWAAAALRITDYTATGIVTFITNRKWLAGRSYPAMREDILSRFDRIIVDDLGGDTRGAGGHAEDQSVFATDVAPGVTIGTAIVTAVRYPDGDLASGVFHEDDPVSAKVHRRIVAGSAKAKRKALRSFSEAEINSGTKGWIATKSKRWKLSAPLGVDEWATLDEYFSYNNSGVQPVRDPVVTDIEESALTSRMGDYFDPDTSWDELVERHPGFGVRQSRYDGPKIRSALLSRNNARGWKGISPLRVVPCLWRPLHGRWLYWETDTKLLNEARRDLVPFMQIPKQVCLISTQTRRRIGAARPLVSIAVPTFGAMDPDARVLPLWSPALRALLGEQGESGASPEAGERPNISESYIAAAMKAGVQGTVDEVAQAIFFALCGVVASADWLDSQPVEHDDFPMVPVPSDPHELVAASQTGRRYAQLVDPWTDVEGVTKGHITQHLRDLAVPDLVTGPDPVLEYGSRNRSGGRHVAGDLLWNNSSGWRTVPKEITEYSLGGWSPVEKYLSYFVGETLTLETRRRVTIMVRRIAELRRLETVADAHFAAAKSDPLEAR